MKVLFSSDRNIKVKYNNEINGMFQKVVDSELLAS